MMLSKKVTTKRSASVFPRACFQSRSQVRTQAMATMAL